MLRQPQVNDKTADSYVNLQLDGLARNILQRRMRSVYSHLTSGIRVRHNCALDSACIYQVINVRHPAELGLE